MLMLLPLHQHRSILAPAAAASQRIGEMAVLSGRASGVPGQPPVAVVGPNATYLVRRTGTGSHYGTCMHWGTGLNGAARRGRTRLPCARHDREHKSVLQHRFVLTIMGLRGGEDRRGANCRVRRAGRRVV